MKRRDFLKTSVVAGAALSIDFTGLQAALSSNTMAVEQAPEMVAVMGGEPEVMLDKALETLGGIGKYIKKGQKVVIKPNIGWDRTPELAGNTNPGLIKALVKKCLEALEGVNEAAVSHENGTAVVTLGGTVTDEALTKAVEDQDYKVISIQ